MGGVPKPLLFLAQTLSEIGRGELWLSTTEAWSATYAKAFCVPQILDPGRGPARALRAAADGVRAPWILLVGGDQIIDAALVATMRAALTPDLDAIVPARDRPLPGLYRAQAVRDLEVEDDAALKQVVARLRVLELPAIRVADVNTWADYIPSKPV